MQKAGAPEITWNHSISVFNYCQMGTRNKYFLLKHQLSQSNSTTFSWKAAAVRIRFLNMAQSAISGVQLFFNQLKHMRLQWDDAWMEGSNCSGPLLSSTLYFKMTSKLEKNLWIAPFLNVMYPRMRCTNSWLSNENTIDIPNVILQMIVD